MDPAYCLRHAAFAATALQTVNYQDEALEVWGSTFNVGARVIYHA